MTIFKVPERFPFRHALEASDPPSIRAPVMTFRIDMANTGSRHYSVALSLETTGETAT